MRPRFWRDGLLRQDRNTTRNGAKVRRGITTSDDIAVEESSGNVFADLGYPNAEEALTKSRLAPTHRRDYREAAFDAGAGRCLAWRGPARRPRLAVWLRADVGFLRAGTLPVHSSLRERSSRPGQRILTTTRKIMASVHSAPVTKQMARAGWVLRRYAMVWATRAIVKRPQSTAAPTGEAPVST